MCVWGMKHRLWVQTRIEVKRVGGEHEAEKRSPESMRLSGDGEEKPCQAPEQQLAQTVWLHSEQDGNTTGQLKGPKLHVSPRLGPGQRGAEVVAGGAGVVSRAPRRSWGWGSAGRGVRLAGEMGGTSGSYPA